MLGLQGVSVAVVALLLAFLLYAQKASTVGGMAVSAGARATHDLQVAAGVLLLALLVGIVNWDGSRTQELWQATQAVEWRALLDGVLP
ncbi:hypothetical protein HUG12_10800 [Halorarum salinum]|uniref:Uncharacterized protein n=2 Tax=Halorarum salinum TaxID=2743089 RepID=A0A7D5QEE5_9EURY|nr:hypothetical protein HUG12_10800 [Halobaculum salinum]